MSVINFKDLRPAANYPTYPPYHQGYYLEEYFYHFYKRNKEAFDKTGYTLIPIFWTNVYNNGVNRNLIQFFLNALPEGKYFTISQHDDAVKEILPKSTLSFEAGGNGNGIPIPLICSPIKISHQQDKSIFCSFVGSINTSPIREKLFKLYSTDSDFIFDNQQWVPNIPTERLNAFVDITQKSRFALCPRGYGAQSFRLYEVLQIGTIPVIVYDKPWFPFNDEILWSDFAVLVHVDEIGNLKQKLKNITPTQQQIMISKGREIYNKYFTFDTVSNHILRILQNDKK
jgi:hypothetical protein